MKILLLGRRGQLGRELARALPLLGPLEAWDRARADLADPRGLLAEMEAAAPEVIVNAAAYTAVDAAETHRRQAYRVNGAALNVLAGYAARTGALLVHYSTDYVFDGRKAGAYTESDAPRPLNVYGMTKLAGERVLRRRACQAFVFRTSWLYSPDTDRNFMGAVARLALSGDQLDMVDDQVGSPTSAAWVAEMTAHALAAWRRGALPAGLYHLAARGCVSRYAWACGIVAQLRAAGFPVRLRTERIRPVRTQDVPRPAMRPLNTPLDSGRLGAALGIPIPHWRPGAEAAALHLARRLLE